MFQFTRFAPNTYSFSIGYPAGWVAPFGNPKIKACYRLLRAYRRLPRPSSPLDAKTSAMCPWARDHSDPTSSNRHEPFSGYAPVSTCPVDSPQCGMPFRTSHLRIYDLPSWWTLDPLSSQTCSAWGGRVDRQIVSNHAVVKEQLVALFPLPGCHFVC